MIHCFPSCRAIRPYAEGSKAAASTLTIVELKEMYPLEKWQLFDDDMAFIATRTPITSVDCRITLLASELNYVRKKSVRSCGMADSITPATTASNDFRVPSSSKATISGEGSMTNLRSRPSQIRLFPNLSFDFPSRM